MHTLPSIIFAAEERDLAGRSLEAIVQTITVAAAVIGLVSAFVQYLQTRIRPKSDSALAALRLRTALTRRQARALRFEKPGLALFGALGNSVFVLFYIYLLYISYASSDYSISGSSALIAVIGIIEFGLFAVVGWSLFFQMRRIKSGKPINQKRAVLIVEADLAKTVSACQQTVAALRASTIRSKSLLNGQQAQVVLQASMRSWPRQGQQVSFRVRQWFNRYCSIEIESASFRPGLFLELKNVSTVRQILRSLL